MTAAADKPGLPVQLSQELLAAFPLPPTHIHLSPSLSPASAQYEPYHSPRVSRRPHTDSRLPLPEESPSPLPQPAPSPGAADAVRREIRAAAAREDYGEAARLQAELRRLEMGEIGGGASAPLAQEQGGFERGVEAFDESEML